MCRHDWRYVASDVRNDRLIDLYRCAVCTKTHETPRLARARKHPKDVTLPCPTNQNHPVTAR